MSRRKVGRSYGIEFSFRQMISEILFDNNMGMSGRLLDIRAWHIENGDISIHLGLISIFMADKVMEHGTGDMYTMLTTY